MNDSHIFLAFVSDCMIQTYHLQLNNLFWDYTEALILVNWLDKWVSFSTGQKCSWTTPTPTTNLTAVLSSMPPATQGK